MNYINRNKTQNNPLLNSLEIFKNNNYKKLGKFKFNIEDKSRLSVDSHICYPYFPNFNKIKNKFYKTSINPNLKNQEILKNKTPKIEELKKSKSIIYKTVSFHKQFEMNISYNKNKDFTSILNSFEEFGKNNIYRLNDRENSSRSFDSFLLNQLNPSDEIIIKNNLNSSFVGSGGFFDKKESNSRVSSLSNPLNPKEENLKILSKNCNILTDENEEIILTGNNNFNLSRDSFSENNNSDNKTNENEYFQKIKENFKDLNFNKTNFFKHNTILKNIRKSKSIENDDITENKLLSQKQFRGSLVGKNNFYKNIIINKVISEKTKNNNINEKFNQKSELSEIIEQEEVNFSKTDNQKIDIVEKTNYKGNTLTPSFSKFNNGEEIKFSGSPKNSSLACNYSNSNNFGSDIQDNPNTSDISKVNGIFSSVYNLNQSQIGEENEEENKNINPDNEINNEDKVQNFELKENLIYESINEMKPNIENEDFNELINQNLNKKGIKHEEKSPINLDEVIFFEKRNFEIEIDNKKNENCCQKNLKNCSIF